MAASLNILLVGDMTETEPPSHFRHAFQKLGHSVSDLATPPLYQPSSLNELVNRVLSPIAPTPDFWGAGVLNERVVTKAREVKPDLIIFFHPRFIHPKTLRQLRAESAAKLFSWFPGDAFHAPNASRFFYESLPLYDCHFTPNDFNISEFLHNGASKSVWLPPAVSPLLRPVPVKNGQSRFRADVGLIADWEKDERVTFMETLVSEGFDVKIFGRGWQNVDPKSPLSVLAPCPIRTEDIAQALGNFKIACVFSRPEARAIDLEQTYRVPACAAFLLHQRTTPALEVFREGIEAEYFDNYVEFREKIRFYLANAEARELIAKKGCERSGRPDISYEARANEMVAYFRNFSAAA